MYMKKIKNIILEEYNKSILTNEEQKIVDDILSINENYGSIIDKIKKYGKKGLLTLGILLTVAGSVEAKGGEGIDVLKTGVEYVDSDEKTKFYSFLVGVVTDQIEDAMKGGNIEHAAGLKELRNHYVKLRDKEQPRELSKLGKVAEKVVKEQLDNETFSRSTFNYYIKKGGSLKPLP
jgi:hypothetical protein